MKTALRLLLFCLLSATVTAPAQTAEARDATVKVIQVLKDGVLARVIADDGESPRLAGSTVFIFTKTGTIADGDEFQPQLFFAGTMRYTTSLGVVATVRTFSLNTQDAAAHRPTDAGIK